MHFSQAQIEAGLAALHDAPKDAGRIELIVRRPAVNAREILDVAAFDPVEGLVGDTWKQRRSSRTPDGSPHPEMQINIMSSRVIALLAGSPDRWALAGDQLFVDLDLSAANLPPGTKLAVGTAVLEVTPQPHTGCGKFVERFGIDAMKVVNSPSGRAMNLRGINARVLQAGEARPGDLIRRLP